VLREFGLVLAGSVLFALLAAWVLAGGTAPPPQGPEVPSSADDTSVAVGLAG
jgi:hypothetical protein